MKKDRQSIILDIINNNRIYTQQQLQNALKSKGFITTQATLSRDINDLQLSKYNGYYVKKSLYIDNSDYDNLIIIFKQSVISVKQAQNIVVIKTTPGFANSACIAVDNMHVDGLVGTLAGDDTAFIAMEDNSYASIFVSEINNKLQND